MSLAPERDVAEALAALQRLHRHGVLSLDEAREAARLISGDDSYEFPAPASPPPAGQAAAEGGAATPS